MAKMDDSYQPGYHPSKKSIEQFSEDSIEVERKIIKKKSIQNLSTDSLEVQVKNINGNPLLRDSEEKIEKLHEIGEELKAEQSSLNETSTKSKREEIKTEKDLKTDNSKLNDLNEKLESEELIKNTKTQQSINNSKFTISRPKLAADDLIRDHRQTAEKIETISNETMPENPKVIISKHNSKSKKLSEEKDEEESSKKNCNIISDSTFCVRESKQKLQRNQSDIFSLKAVPTNLHTSIFSVNGSPSRKLFKKDGQLIDHILASNRTEEPTLEQLIKKRESTQNYNDKERPSNTQRNPLTGSGVSSNDEYKKNEYKSNCIRRKDGNPLLGVGYESGVSHSASKNRIPPGGYSHKLW